jgi:hypothetical protein
MTPDREQHIRDRMNSEDKTGIEMEIYLEEALKELTTIQGLCYQDHPMGLCIPHHVTECTELN